MAIDDVVVDAIKARLTLLNKWELISQAIQLIYSDSFLFLLLRLGIQISINYSITFRVLIL